jgi:hypothetical protein
MSAARLALEPAQDSPQARFTQSDSNGTYKFRVAPGKYKLAIVDADTVGNGMMGLDLDDYQPETVEVSAGDKIVKDLTKPNK